MAVGVRAAAGSPSRFFTDLLGAFEEAVDAVTVQTVELELADRIVGLEFAGPHLRPLMTPALNHLASRGMTPEFTIKIFDSLSTGVVPPPPAWGPSDYRAQGEIAGFNTARFRTVYRVEAGCLSMIDLERGRAIFWIRDPAAYPAWMRAAPLRTLIGWWATAENLQMVHGAGIGSTDAGILITAPGGAGKSTSALRCLLAGMRYAGDDYVIVDPTARRICSVYSTAKADDAAVDRFFPHLRTESSGLIESETTKHVFQLDRLFATQLGDIPLSAIVVPGLTDGPTRFAPMGPARALKALAPTTLFQLAASGPDEFGRMAALVRSVPVFSLEVSRSGEIAGTVRELLHELGSEAS